MAEHAHLKNEFTANEKYHNFMRWLEMVHRENAAVATNAKHGSVNFLFSRNTGTVALKI